MLRSIKLYGQARLLFGDAFTLDVATIGEAVRAISSQVEGFRAYVEKHDFQVVVGSSRRDGFECDKDLVGFLLPDGDIHIVPVLKGAKRGGIGKIIAGLLMVAVAFFVPFAAGLAGGMSATIFGSFTYGNLAILGAGLIATGVSQMLTKQKKPDNKKDDSFMIDGIENGISQGGPVPLVYGRTMTGSVLFHASVITSDYNGGTTKLGNGGTSGSTGSGSTQNQKDFANNVLGRWSTASPPTNTVPDSDKGHLGSVGWTVAGG